MRRRKIFFAKVGEIEVLEINPNLNNIHTKLHPVQAAVGGRPAGSDMSREEWVHYRGDEGWGGCSQRLLQRGTGRVCVAVLQCWWQVAHGNSWG